MLIHQLFFKMDAAITLKVTLIFTLIITLKGKYAKGIIENKGIFDTKPMLYGYKSFKNSIYSKELEFKS